MSHHKINTKIEILLPPQKQGGALSHSFLFCIFVRIIQITNQ